MKNYLSLLLFCFSTFLSAQSERHLILITVDGFRPDFYKHQEWPAPNLQFMMKEGVYADEVKTIFPSVTYPSHTTIVTGQLPAKHGIYYNTHIDEKGKAAGWIYDSKDIKSKTIWEALKEEGLSTASVSWPITLNNKFIDYNVPEIWSFKNGNDRISASRQFSTPSGLFEEAMKNSTGEMQINEFNLTSIAMDQNLGRIAGYILKKYKPNFMTLHLPIVDGAQHSQGRDGDKVRIAVSNADSVIGLLLDVIRQNGLAETTDVIVTGDHGFVTRKFNISPNVWLKDKGLSDKAFFFSSGGSAFLYLKSQKDQETLTKIVEMLEMLPNDQRKLFKIISGKDLSAAQVDPESVLALSAIDGYAFTNDSDGEIITQSSGGSHGYYPDFYNIYTGFVGYGPSFRRSVKVENLKLTDFFDLSLNILHRVKYKNPRWATILK